MALDSGMERSPEPKKVYIAVDNGVTGSIGIITETGDTKYIHTPIKKELSYTKKKQWINRIDGEALYTLLRQYATEDVQVYLERPLVNPGMFKATISAIRALEATLIIVERLKYPYQYVDSKQWQSTMLPSGLKGSVELKKASLQIGKRMYPNLDFKGFKDADGLLMAAWASKK
jgi:hypothetical protein